MPNVTILEPDSKHATQHLRLFLDTYKNTSAISQQDSTSKSIAEWIRHWTPEQKIPGSNPPLRSFFFLDNHQ